MRDSPPHDPEFLIALNQSAVTLVLDHHGRLVRFNALFEHAVGAIPETLRGRRLTRWLGPESREVLRSILSILLKGLSWKGELELKGRNGQPTWLECTVVPFVAGETGEPCYRLIGFDVTERKAIKSALERERLFQKTLMQFAPVGFLLANEAGYCVYANQRWLEISGQRLRTAIGEGWLSAVHPDDRDEVQAAWTMHIRQGAPFHREFRYVQPGKAERVVLASSVAITAASGGTQYLRAEQDLTEAKNCARIIDEQRAQITHASKLTALAEMCGGVAHEVNNPLAIILGRVTVLEAQLETGAIDPQKVLEQVRKIGGTAQRIAQIIRSMRAIARNGEQDPFESASLSDILNETIQFSESRFREENVRLHVSVPVDLSPVECRPSEISQIFLNLLTNALDALHEQADKQVWIEFKETADQIELSVSNNGPPVPASIRDKILDPFFTTKLPGKGTGLGLSLSRAIAKSHGGDLWLSSDPERTRFCFSVLKLQTPLRKIL